MNKILGTSLSCLFVAILSSCAERGQVAQPTAFEGTITEVIHVPGIGKLMSGVQHRDSSSSSDAGPQAGAAMGAFANIGLKIYARPNQVAYDISMMGGLFTMHSIVDRNARTITVLLPNQSAMVMDLRSLDSQRKTMSDSLEAHNGLFDSIASAIPVPTGKHQSIEGIDAEEYHAMHGNIESDVWVASDSKLEAFDVVRDAFLGRGTEGSGGLDQVFGMMRPVAGKIPVKFEMKMDGQTITSGELTNVSEEKLDNSLFEIPKGYTVVRGDSLHSMQRGEKQEEKHQEAKEDKPVPHVTSP